ncbi:hypothetical protein HD601_002543 [Jiangella mangrovi]|uniref:Uncharacterized protein n=1 Tax=Jiangella mangrovi TaxID=1524084 RepID=A0A7W9GQ31_9ACTN|nr:hypothetical protein [Jiangella mangrovi]
MPRGVPTAVALIMASSMQALRYKVTLQARHVRL